MANLDDDHQDVAEYFRSGGFSVQIGSNNPFGCVPVDQTCDETVNKDTQTPGGTKGFSLKPNAVSKYYLIAEYRSIFMRQFKEMINLGTAANSKHNDLQPSRIARDEADVKSLLSMLYGSWINPFLVASGKELIIKSDRAVFAQIIIIAENRKLKISEVLCNPLGSLPWALATADGSLRKNNKASLAKELKKNVTPTDELPQPCARILDGMAMVQKIRGDQKTFSEVADTLMSVALNEGIESERFDVVFDFYRENPIKGAEREKRGSESGHEFRNIKSDHKIRQWRKFLLSPTNKSQLIKFISEEWQRERFTDRIASKTIFVTTEEKCFEISSQGTRERDVN
ncbi:hypothetical protein AC249_AIPGENE21951 [Exaiptasia diaphana]|nr:hypothetical protein AC249_AIPGENE21951 [Exaiptasia diaphana]